MIRGVVLAGGASRRMGSPKALLRLGELTMLERIFETFRRYCSDVWIVTGEHDAEIRQSLPGLASHYVLNAHHERGQFSSLQIGLNKCATASSVLFSPVDFGGVRPATVEKLFEGPGAPVVKPRWRGHSGHPVLVSGEALAALRNAAASANAKEILAAFEARYVDVEDRAVSDDADSPDDYRRLLSWWKDSQ